MNNKNIVLSIIACMGAVLLILPMFLDVWGYYINTTQTYKYGLFDNFDNIKNVFIQGNGKFQGIWAVLVTISSVLALAIGAAFILFSILQILKIGKIKYNFIRRVLSLTLIILFVASTVFGSVFTMVNVYSYNIPFLGEVLVTMEGALGFYLLIIGTGVSGLSGLFSTFEKKKTKHS